MARSHGRNGAVYLGVTNGAAASPVTFQASWTVSMTVDKQDVTAFGDQNKIYVGGLPDASGDFSGFWDDATGQTYLAATDGLPRNMYLYPNITTDPNVYFFGTCLPDFEMDGAVGGPVNTKTTWNASSKIQRYNPVTGGLNT
jgi:hypothetical protein